jgi:hypothetical protein
MKKLKVVKRVLSVLLTGLIGLNSIGLLATATDDFSYFSYGYNLNNYYIATLKEDYVTIMQNIGTTEIVYPEEYDDGVNGKAPVNFFQLISADDNYVTTIKFNSNCNGASTEMFGRFKALKKVEFTYTGLDFTLPGNMAWNRHYESDSIEELYIYASSVNITSNAVFRAMNTNLKVYVTSKEVKNTIVTKTASGSYPISADQVIVMANEKQESEFTISCDNINYGTEGGLKPQTNIIAGDEEITYKLYSDEACENEYKGYSYSSALLPIGTYYIKGYMAATDNYKMSESNVVKVEVLRNFVNSKALASAIEEAEKLYNESNKDDYQAEAWNNVFSATGTLQKAKSIYNDTEGLYNQSQVDTAAENLNTSLVALKNSLADTTASRAALEEAIKKAEAILPGNYTDESYTKLTEAIANAKLLDQNALNSVLIAAKNNIDTAISGLTEKEKEPAGEPFAVINKNAVETTLGEFTADEAVAGATKIKITFNCADDVSFNQYASIEAKASIAGVESYMKFAGTDSSQTAGAKGFTIELPLTSEIKSGDDVKLVAYTWAWANANDYVYAVTKVEYINAVGQVVKAVTDRTIALDELKAAIAEAEKIESDNYTEDSYAELTTALTAAKELPEDSEKADIEAAKTALETAVAGLVEKTDDSSSESIPDSESTPDSESSSDTDADSSSKTEDESSSKTDDSSNDITSKTDSAGSDSKAGITENANNSGAGGTSNPNTGAASAAAAGIILLSAIGVIASRKK